MCGAFPTRRKDFLVTYQTTIRGGDAQVGAGAGTLKARCLASGVHLGVSVLVAALVLSAIYLGWYRGPLATISGVGEILVLLLAVDVTLGPLLTFVVFDRRKKRLSLDLACIGSLQLAALLYGLQTLEAGRPHYVVFVKDRFEVVSRADIREEDRKAAEGTDAARTEWLGPRIVAAAAPSSEDERKKIMFESAFGGRDLQHFPRQYREYASEASLAVGKAGSLADLRALNPADPEVLDQAVAGSGLPESRLRYLPIKGPQGDAAMLVDASSGAIAGMVGLRPWR